MLDDEYVLNLETEIAGLLQREKVRIAELERERKALVNFVQMCRGLAETNRQYGTPYTSGKANAYLECADNIEAQFKLSSLAGDADDAGGSE